MQGRLSTALQASAVRLTAVVLLYAAAKGRQSIRLGRTPFRAADSRRSQSTTINSSINSSLPTTRDLQLALKTHRAAFTFFGEVLAPNAAETFSCYPQPQDRLSAGNRGSRTQAGAACQRKTNATTDKKKERNPKHRSLTASGSDHSICRGNVE